MLPEEIALAPEFQCARHGEATLVGDITADAFRDDPFNACRWKPRMICPHAHRFTIGVCPTARKGPRPAVDRPVLEACDRAGLPAYLENSNPDNRGFYGACGFEHVAMLEPEPDAPPLEAMARQPRS